jgi:hypothetical protein
MTPETRTVFYRLTIMSDHDGLPAVVMHETKSARFFGGEQLTAWQPDAPTDLPLPLAVDLLGEINAALVATNAQMANEIAALKSAIAT